MEIKTKHMIIPSFKSSAFLYFFPKLQQLKVHIINKATVKTIEIISGINTNIEFIKIYVMYPAGFELSASSNALFLLSF